MPPFVKKEAARSHSENLAVVCAVCWRKNKNVRSVSEKVCEQIKQFVFSDYSSSNGFHPTAICDGCRNTLSDVSKVCFNFRIILSFICLFIDIYVGYFSEVYNNKTSP